MVGATQTPFLVASLFLAINILFSVVNNCVDML